MYRMLVCCAVLVLSAAAMAEGRVVIAVHGGAGTIAPNQLEPEREAAIRDALERAVRAGHEVLTHGGHSQDAVVAAIHILEDAPEFNAGRGAVLTNTGTIEMDASIMNGETLEAGAVAAIQRVRHPIDAAVAVMKHSPHVMLTGEGAITFAARAGLEMMDQDWFMTDFRRRELESIQAESQTATRLSESWFSTVGAVALDSRGNLAAATSTGGMTNKRWGRVGDTPIIGAGTYADNRSCAVSGTGHGEFFIRHAVAHDICARKRYQGVSLAEAADEVINRVLLDAGGSGGVIAIDPDGQISMPFNTTGMYRAAIDRDGQLQVLLYREDDGTDAH